MTEQPENLENENSENENIAAENAAADIIEEKPVIIINEAPKPDESKNSATIAELVATISGLNDTISGLRLQIENERNTYADLILDTFNSRMAELDAKIDALAAIKQQETTNETGGDKTAVATVTDAVKEVSRKPVKRWF